MKKGVKGYSVKNQLNVEGGGSLRSKELTTVRKRMQRHLLVKGMVSGNQITRVIQAVQEGASLEDMDLCSQR